MLLPLRDMNPTRRFPLMNWLLIAANLAAFWWELSLPPQVLDAALTHLAVVPAEITADPYSLESALDVLRSMFLHAGWLHLLGNMLYLFLFGDNVEDRFGSLLYLLLYVTSGFAAVAAQAWMQPDSIIPMVGASGAIAGVLGSYLVLFPGVRVRGVIPIGIFPFFLELPAWLVLLGWFGVQLLSGALSLGALTQETGGVAFFAHIGGFVFGMAAALVFMLIVPQPPRERRRQVLYERAGRRRRRG